MCAGRSGQLLNVSTLASDCGISIPTVQSWLSVLQASYIIFLLQPHHVNFNKRLVKSTKLYFYDTGLACSLLGIDQISQLQTHYIRGALFENYMIADIVKQFYNKAKNPTVYFWRDNHGHEVDCIIERGAELLPVEIKASMTFQSNFLNGLSYWQNLYGNNKGLLIYSGNESWHVNNIKIESWQDFDVFELTDQN